MIYNEDVAQFTAAKLLEIEAVKLQPHSPFIWASGWRSPIYCDNRKTLSYPSLRTHIYQAFCRIITEKFAGVDAIAGVATAGIPHGVLVAHALSLPFIYVRSSAKSHGMQNQIEGAYKTGQRVVVVEDLISSGKSSLAAVTALREANIEVAGLLAIFSYSFPAAEDNFQAADCVYYTLSDYPHLLQEALKTHYIKDEDLAVLEAWRERPANWP